MAIIEQFNDFMGGNRALVAKLKRYCGAFKWKNKSIMYKSAYYLACGAAGLRIAYSVDIVQGLKCLRAGYYYQLFFFFP